MSTFRASSTIPASRADLPRFRFRLTPGSVGDFIRTRALPPLACCLGLVGFGATTGAHAGTWPVTEDQRNTADRVAKSGVALADIAPGAPDQYSVKSGDTLWAIATLYLKSPWRWPELWGMNQEEIRNPHLIYPGQTLRLVRTADGKAHLVLSDAPAKSAGISSNVTASTEPDGRTVRLSPRLRELESGENQAISSIPNNLIEPFLSRPEVLPESSMDQLARVVATPDDRVFLGRGDTAYARGLSGARVENFNVLRPARPLYEADDERHQHPIAYEAAYLGTVRLSKPGEVSTLTVTSSQQEIGVGDRLMPIERQAMVNYAPHRLETPLVGRIISVYSGVHSVGAGSIVTLDRGTRDGLEIGHVLGVFHNGGVIVDKTAPDHEHVRLPNERVGTMFVFRVFNGISYGLLMTATGPIQVGDWLGQPDQPLEIAQPN